MAGSEYTAPAAGSVQIIFTVCANFTAGQTISIIQNGVIPNGAFTFGSTSVGQGEISGTAALIVAAGDIIALQNGIGTLNSSFVNTQAVQWLMSVFRNAP